MTTATHDTQISSRATPPHVSVCICTYKRPQLLRQLLAALQEQTSEGSFTYSIVVIDNDAAASARDVVADYAASKVAPRYAVEPRQNIALARNAGIAHSTGELAAWIDDDETPAPDWLLQLWKALQHYQADGVLGPVMPRFAIAPPDWILRGRIFERPALPTGTWLTWKQTRTGNVLVRRSIFADPQARFRHACGEGGEDVDFFQRMIRAGRRFVWCAEAAVHETVPPERCTRSYVLKRALRRGRAPTNQGWPVATSLVAAPIYALALPALLPFGQHVFMRYLIKECDHLGRILAALRRN